METTQEHVSVGLPLLPSPASSDGILSQSDVSLPPAVKGYSFIYRLLDPHTYQPRYIGRTITPAGRRTSHHSARKHSPLLVSCWWNEVVTESGGASEPVMQIIGGPVLNGGKAMKLERDWERRHQQAGCDLLNVAPCGGGGVAGPRRWPEDKARQKVVELMETLGLEKTYPTATEFCTNGLSGLYSTISHNFGGHRKMARELGVVRQRSEEWCMASAQEAVSDLVDHLGIRGCYPTEKQFIESGLGGLYSSLDRRLEGNAELARALGLRQQKHARWTAQAAEEAVLEIVQRLGLKGRYPTQPQFIQTGYGTLYVTVLNRLGGHPSMAEKLNLVRAWRPPWSQEEAQAEISALVEKLNLGCYYPTRVQFRDNGLRGLGSTIVKRLGGHPEMALELKLQMRRGGRVRASA